MNFNSIPLLIAEGIKVAVDLRATVGEHPRSEIAGYHCIRLRRGIDPSD